jgi:hypothetical protein
MRATFLSVPLAALLVACGGERPRPGPLDPGEPADLSVQILEPTNGQTVLGGKTLQVRVTARDLDGSGLVGVGMVARRATTTLDSQVVSFPARADSQHVFVFDVPNTFPTSTQIDLRGLAFGTGNARRASEIRSVVLIQCTPQIPVCQ